MQDGSEDAPGELLKERNASNLLYDYEADTENTNRISGFLKE
jgi:hypothetical protein